MIRQVELLIGEVHPGMNCSLVEWQRILNLVCRGSDEGLVVKQLNVFFLGFLTPRTGKNSKTTGHRTRDHTGKHLTRPRNARKVHRRVVYVDT